MTLVVILISLTLLLLAIVIYGIMIYNTIIKHKNSIDNAFASVDVMLKKRHELIPNLVNAVKGYMNHEQGTLNEIVSLRNRAEHAALPLPQKLILENALSQSLEKVLLQVEDYPDLKASENFLQLQQALNTVEEYLSASRRFYNAAVTQYNNSIEIFPNNLIASRFGFLKQAVFESKNEERQHVDLNKQFNQAEN